MVDLDKLPKLLQKEHWDEYAKRDKEDVLTSQDMDDRLETFEWFVTTYTSKEFQEFKDKKTR